MVTGERTLSAADVVEAGLELVAVADARGAQIADLHGEKEQRHQTRQHEQAHEDLRGA